MVTASRAEDPEFDFRLLQDFSGSSHTNDLKLALQWLPCQAPGFTHTHTYTHTHTHTHTHTTTTTTATNQRMAVVTAIAHQSVCSLLRFPVVNPPSHCSPTPAGPSQTMQEMDWDFKALINPPFAQSHSSRFPGARLFIFPVKSCETLRVSAFNHDGHESPVFHVPTSKAFP